MIEPCIVALVVARPEVAIVVSRSRDEHFRWDGDGPDPESEGFRAYDVTVQAITIRAGVVIKGASHLGGSYFKPSVPCGDIHGYLPQMVDEALAALDLELAK